jgi:UDP-N-acetylmuramoyl-L-alanyl-D-glutamate--2,6-diaminopimelate ligase
VKCPITVDGYDFITDDTNAVDAKTLFLRTSQNQRYYDAMEHKPESIGVDELIDIWGIKTLKIVGVTGTNGKTTTTAAIYSFLLDLGENPALQGTRGLFAGEERIEEKSMTTPSILETLHNMKQVLESVSRGWILH